VTDDPEVPAVIEDWNARLSAALGIPPADADAVLGLAGVVARAVIRPAAPLTAYLVGYAAARAEAQGTAPEAAFAEAAQVARDLAAAAGE
jgi:hypothetical protein